MSDTANTDGASDADLDGSGDPNPGASDDGGSGTGDSGADAFASERERLTKQARDLQAARDRERAEREKLQRELAEMRGNTDRSGDQPEYLTAEAFRAELKRQREMDRSVAKLREEFSEADAGIFEDLDRFDSVEALRATVERSHTARKAYADKVKAEAQEEARRILAERGIELPDPKGTPEGVKGLPGPAELAKMTERELDALEAEHGSDVIDRILAQHPVDRPLSSITGGEE